MGGQTAASEREGGQLGQSRGSAVQCRDVDGMEQSLDAETLVCALQNPGHLLQFGLETNGSSGALTTH